MATRMAGRMGQAALKFAETAGDIATDLPVGEILRRARAQYNLSLEQVETDLRIRLEFLQAIEKGAYHRLPSRVYVIGFVRSYAEYLGLDGQKIIDLLKQQGVGHATPKPELNFPVQANDSTAPSKWTTWVSFGVIALLLIGGTLASKYKQTHAIPEVPQELQQAAAPAPVAPEAPASDIPAAPFDPALANVTPAPVAADGSLQSVAPVDPNAVATAVATPAIDPLTGQPVAIDPAAIAPTDAAQTAAATAVAPAAAPATTVPPLVMKALEDVWMQVRTGDGKLLYSGILKNGKSLVLREDRADLMLTTGNAGGLEVYLEGQKVPTLGESGQVRKNVSLNKSGLGL